MGNEIREVVYWFAEVSALTIEALAVAIITLSVLVGMGSYVRHVVSARALIDERFNIFRSRIARALLLGLELLVAADIVKTVVLDPTFESVAVLGLLVIIRIFLGWSLIVELEGRWPWQEANASSEEKVDV
jgi:uncharacterized membrane protein